LILANKEIGLEVNVDKSKYKFTSRDQNAGRSHTSKIDIFFKFRVFKYLEITLTNQNSNEEEVKNSLN